MKMSRSRRKGPVVVPRLLERVERLDKQSEDSVVIKTWARSMTIMPSMIGVRFGVHNGRQHLPVVVSDQMVGHKLGEFSPTRRFSYRMGKDKRRRK
jgi:small subunit ribosomal protein S19